MSFMKRRWLLWLLVIAFVWIVVSRLTEIRKLVETLAQGQGTWVLAAALLQVIYYLAYTALYQSAFYSVGVKSRIDELLPVVFAAVFVNVAAPTGGASGAALFVDNAARRGQSATRTAAGMVLMLAANLSAFTLVLAIGMVYLFWYQDLAVYQIIGAAILLLMLGGLTGVLVLGLWQPDYLRQFLTWLQRIVNWLAGRLKRPALLTEDWAEKNATEFSEAATAIVAHPHRLGRTLAVALAAHLVNLTSLYTLFLAFHQPVEFGVLVAGYAMGILFWIVSPAPQGIGVVEGVMALVYTSLKVPAEKATVVALAFRGLTFWLPFAIGFFLLRRVRSFGTVEVK